MAESKKPALYRISETIVSIIGYTTDEDINKKMCSKGIKSYKYIGGTPDTAMYYEHPYKPLTK